MRTEIADLETLRAHREAGKDLRGAVLITLDLTGHDELLRTAMDGAILLGCRLSTKARQQAEAAGALLFPEIEGLPFQTYRSRLYTPDELFAGFDPARPESYADTPDARIYQYFQDGHTDPLHALAERLHDHAITSALEDVLARTPHPVAVMGGHALCRDDPGYATCARLGAALGASPTGFTVLTGGGPGAMEAVPFGVRLNADLDDALRELSTVARFGSEARAAFDPAAIGAWLAAAVDVPLHPASDPPSTIGIPTWFYGHEPPNLACEQHAKYFANSVREDGLLTVATGGVVYTPGSAGTVQEIFADYTQNHYASVGPPAPMVFLGADYWTAEVPAAPLVQQLARGREAEKWILVTDDVAEAVELLDRYATTQL